MKIFSLQIKTFPEKKLPLPDPYASVEIVEQLLEAGLEQKINEKNNADKTPLDVAIESYNKIPESDSNKDIKAEYKKIIELLWSNGATCNSNKNKSLMEGMNLELKIKIAVQQRKRQ